MPTFLDLARKFLSGAANVGGRAGGLPEFRVSEALASAPKIGPQSGLAGQSVSSANQVLGAQAPYQRTTSGFASSLAGGSPSGQRITGGGGGGFAQPTGAPNLQQGA